MTTADPIDSARHHTAAAAAAARQSMPPEGYDGRNGSYAPAPSGATTPLPHIDDVVAMPQDIDRNQPMNHLLDMAEKALANSEISRDFGKPALALRDFVRASVIVVQIIPSHADYLELKSSRTDWRQRQSRLQKRIAQQNDIYDRIKQDVIADNGRSGVQPTTVRAASQRNGVEPASASSFSAGRSPASPRQQLPYEFPHPLGGSFAKAKPAIQPKPQSLAGNAIRPGHARAASAVSGQANFDLAARFANLGGPPQSLPGQDPRIKTHQIIPPKPAGPREMPPSQRPKISLDSAIPAMPKIPDAIYSPARGSVSGEASRLPTSTPRGLFSRTGSSISISTPRISQQQNNNDCFQVQPQIFARNGHTSPPIQSDNTVRIPEGDTITPEELLEAMKSRGSVLIIDVRVRDDFNEGHIMSSSTICIEPSILAREDISAEEISESLVLSPSQEQVHFERRATYDLVVLYDQDSTRIQQTPRNPDEIAMGSIYRALVHLSYGQELRNPPKVLEGGLDAWVDLLGPSSLRSTSSQSPTRRPPPVPNHRSPFQRRPSQYIGKPLKPDIVKAWQETVENEEKETETATEQAFHRSTESFLRRFPSLTLQESMVSPAVSERRPQSYGSSHQNDLNSVMPSPPTRPAPALPRPSHSGLSQTIDDLYESTGTTMVNAPIPERIYTGLNNPGNWCYANSILQSLLASRDFGRELSDSEWVNKYQVPRKDDERIDQPQLMIKIISNLFHWMTTSKFQVMKAQTLMDYSLHLCQQYNQSFPQFGGHGQQDAQEFMSFLLDQLHDETNCRRDRKGNAAKPDTKRQSLLRAAGDYWRSYQETNQSIVDRYWRGLDLSTVECEQCHTKTHTFSTFDLVFAPVGVRTLDECLKERAAVNKISDFACETCKRKMRARQSTSFARMPPLLCLAFVRFNYAHGDIRKSTDRITWDFNDVDFSPYFIQTSSSSSSDRFDDRAFSGPFRYECYAVIVHSGSRTDNGHYYAYVRDSTAHDPYAWFKCNDSSVTKVRIGSRDHDDEQNKVFKSGADCVPYLVFFRRKS